MGHAIRIHSNGGPDVMRWEPVEDAVPGPGQVRLRHTAIGVNFSDINVRRGGFYLNHAPPFPLGLGNEAAGVVEAVGAGVVGFAPGDRAAYAGMMGQFYEDTGSYSERRIVPAERLVPLPDGVSDEQAAAVLLKGSTASLIINRIYKPGSGDVVLVHAAASGVATILCQWAKHLGATVIGTAGSAGKAAIARARGCDHVILYRETDFIAEVARLAPLGVSAMFDGVGKDTFEASLDCLLPFGTAVNYGNASGPVPPFNIMRLAIRSLSVCRVGVTGHIQDSTSLRATAAELFDLVTRGIITVEVGRTYKLEAAADAHRDVEAAAHAGSLLLVP